MAQTPVRARQGQMPTLLLGGLLLGGLLLMAPDGQAQDATRKAPARPAARVELPSITVASPDKDSVQEMATLINKRLAEGWEANEVTPSRPINDYEFIRRASLDIIGRIATPAEIERFLKDPSTTRRSLLVERLLESEEYAVHWSNLWTTWLLSRSGVFGRGMYQQQTASWLKDEFAANTRYDQLIKKVLTAQGKNSDNGAVNFILAHMGEPSPQARRDQDGAFDMVPITSRITRLFLGMQVQCAQCHDHPFHDSVKQNHFWGVNAFLRQVERVGNLPQQRQDALMTLELKDNTSVNSRATVFYEKRNGVVLVARAEFLPVAGEERGQRLDPSTSGLSRREQLAGFILEHPNFPRAIVNRMWGVFFGKGFVNPIDDFNDNNQPSNPELLDEMAGSFKNYGYDLKQLIRWITHSQAYHLSSVANDTNDKPELEVLFSRMLLKAMTPEQLFESLQTATQGSAASNPAERREAREAWLNTLVANFGDDEGNEVSFNGTVVQALLMMNGQDLNRAVSDKDKGTLAEALKQRSGVAIVNHLYLATLNRPASREELQLISQKIPMRVRDRDPQAPFQDLFWALLNCNEFILNH